MSSRAPTRRTGGERGQRQAVGRAVACMVIGAALLTLNDAVIKWLTSGYPVGQILFMRGMFVFLPLGFLVWRTGDLGVLAVRNVKGQMLRALAVVGSTLCFVTGLSLLPLADAIAIAFAGPFFTVALAGPLLAEPVGWRRWCAVAVGFCGVLLIVRPTGDGIGWAALLPLGAALFGALRDIVTRRISVTESSLGILFYTTAAVTVVGLCSAPLGWQPIPLGDLALMALTGALLCGAHLLQIDAFRFAEASAISPYRYVSMIWAIALGFAIWGDWPDAPMLAGTAVIVGSGVYIWRRERRQARQRKHSLTSPETL